LSNFFAKYLIYQTDSIPPAYATASIEAAISAPVRVSQRPTEKKLPGTDEFQAPRRSYTWGLHA
jgi:hypothetical protein